MKLTIQELNSVKSTHDLYWASYLNGDIDTLESILDEKYTQVGSVENEVFSNKKDATQFIMDTIDQIVGNLQMRNRTTKLDEMDGFVLVTELCDLFVLSDEEWIFYSKFRASTLLKIQGDQWKIIHQHSSLPDSKAEVGENIALEKITEENLQLREAVKRRTIELEYKNRELEIEVALEKVRARTTAMQKSEELSEASFLLDSQVRALGIKTRGCAFNIYGKNDSTEWFSSEMGTLPVYKTPREKIFLSYYEAGQKGESVVIKEFSGQECIDHYKYLCTLPVMGDALNQMIANGGSFPSQQIDHVVFFRFGYLLFITLDPVPEAHDIFKRFTNVFEQTYTRFLDLQMAEAQAREAEIELALERVRARSMAMKNSIEIGYLINHLYGELTKLDANLDRCFIMIINQENQGITWWLAGKEGLLDENGFFIQNNQHPFHTLCIKHWKVRQKKWQYLFEGKEKSDWDDFGFSKTELIKLPEAVKQDMASVKKIFLSCSSDSFGCLVTGSHEPLSENHQDIISRFTIVFDQTYTRFLDLQKAEALAREAQIEAALERVRGKAMAMHKSEQLPETAQVLFQQFAELGKIPDRIAIGIVKEETQVIEWWVTDQSGSQLTSHFDSSTLEPTIAQIFAGWKEGKDELVIELKGTALKEWVAFVRDKVKMPIDESKMQGRRVHHAAFFSQGLLLISAHAQMPDDTMKLLVRFAKVFQQTYTRFLDLQKAEAQALQAEEDLIAIKEAKQKAEEALMELKATQKQLIQSEKMASLGELTAGIAHEIQNPLNFVNNFSEVSKELLDEMKEAISKGDTDDAFEIMNDVILNLQKINHHGKRADAIVKGMLQHSRSSSGKKEMTDINALCDEYLRLSYHGLRAKDKSFNATMNTYFDAKIGQMDIIPQDIGRVVLNLINNAFYAVNEKKQLRIQGYEPTVSINTNKVGDKVLISVHDNGNGIPKTLLDKIFQPFFTTKPTGQGTGLGLSLSYDIIKAHGGELKVETKEGEGTTFTIKIPVQS